MEEIKIKKPRKKRKMPITSKQRKAFENYINGTDTLKGSMIKAGYSESSASVPNVTLTNSEGWKELCEIYLKDSTLAKIHQEQLISKKAIVVNGKIEYVDDNRSRLKALDLAYRCKGKYAPTQVEITKRKYQGLSDADLLEKEKNLKKFLFKL